jgi:hypothetical protein
MDRSKYRYEDSHRCANDFPEEYSECENILCQIWKQQQHAPQFNKATFFCIQTDGNSDGQTSSRSKPYQYLPIRSLKEDTIIHHACAFCVEKHPYKQYMVPYPDGMRAILSKTLGGFHRIYASTPVRSVCSKFKLLSEGTSQLATDQ